MGLRAFGKHLLIDAKKCKSIDSTINIQNFTDDLVSKLGMTKYGDTYIQKFGETPDVEGYSMFQLIQESNISAHFCNYDFQMDRDGVKWNNRGSAYIDIFSCSDYNTNTALDVVQKYFSPEEIKYKEIERI